jgi:fluoroacetyl-CoA thioesterase
MKTSLEPGIRYEHRFVIPASKTVPALYPESAEFLEMPQVFATGFLVGFIEWTCILAVKPHLDWPQEQTVGTRIELSHEAATPPGFEVAATAELLEIDGRKLVFGIEARDSRDLIAKGRHERFIIDREKFDRKLEEKKGGRR